jgi:hypothetical protein
MSRAFSSALLVSAVLSLPAFAGPVPSKDVEKTLPLSSGGRLVLDTYKGRVSITAWDREEASIHAVVTPDGSCDSSAELVARTEVRIEGGGSEVRVESDYDALPKFTFSWHDDCGSRPFVRYEIRVPRGASLRLKDYKSHVSVDGLAGEISIDSYKGTVRLAHVAGKLDLETYKGDVVADLDQVGSGIRAETYKGEIDLRLPKDARVDLEEEIGRRGRLEVELDETRGGVPVSVETYKGTIRVRSR